MQDLEDVSRRSKLVRRRFLAQQPKCAADVIAAVLQRRGYGRILGNQQLSQRWFAAVDSRCGPWTRPVRVFRGRLEVVVSNSAVMQELVFAKSRLIERFNEQSTSDRITDIRFRIGEVDRPLDSNPTH